MAYLIKLKNGLVESYSQVLDGEEYSVQPAAPRLGSMWQNGKFVCPKSAARIEDGTVVEVSHNVWADEQTGGTWIECYRQVSIGWSHDGTDFHPPEMPLELAKQQALARLPAAVEGFIRPFVAKYPEAEQQTWPVQEEEAIAFNDGAIVAADAEFLMALVGGDETKLPALVTAILAKASFFRRLSAKAVALRQETEAGINAATDLAGLEAVIAAMRAQAATAASTFAAELQS